MTLVGMVGLITVASLGHAEPLRASRPDQDEVSLHTYISTFEGVPWVGPISLSQRYVAQERSLIARHLSSNGSESDRVSRAQVASELDSPEQILTDLDRYVLARARDQSFPIQEELESQISLSHTWPSSPNGYLLNAQFLPKSEYWIRRRFKHYGTPEMIAVIKEGVRALRARFPKAPRLIIGDLSKRYGGHFPPHLSHQSGRDADLGYFMRGSYGARLVGLAKVTHRTIDVEKTWAFLSGMLKTGLVESMFIDYKLQRVLYRHAKRQGEWSVQELRKVFSYPARRGRMIRHLDGHSDHMHVRFKAPLSELAASRYMKSHPRLSFRPRKVYTRPKKGETLQQLARRFRVKRRTLMRWNRLSKAQARQPLKRTQRLMVSAYTPYALRRLKFTTMPSDTPREITPKQSSPEEGPAPAQTQSKVMLSAR